MAFDDILASSREKFPRAVVEGVSVQGMAKPGYRDNYWNDQRSSVRACINVRARGGNG